jgi:TetR/AcrR family transcriptional regulator, transcriptional repressor for nem operon
MRYSAEHKEASHSRIVSAAAALLATSGFAGATVDRVMKAAGMTVGGFYRHFKTKEAMLADALRAEMARRRTRWTSGLEGLTGKEWLDQVVRRYLSRQHRDELESGCPMPTVLSELTQADPELRAAFVDGLEPMLQGMASKLPPMSARSPCRARPRDSLSRKRCCRRRAGC